MKVRLLVLFALVMLFVVGAAGVSAAQLEPALEDTVTTTLFTAEESRQVFDAILQALQDAVPISPFVLLIVQFVLKPVADASSWAWLKQRRAPELASLVAIIFVIAGAVTNDAGYGDTFDSVAALLDNLAPPLTTVIAAIAFASGEFNLLQRLGLDNSVMKSRSVSGGTIT